MAKVSSLFTGYFSKSFKSPEICITPHADESTRIVTMEEVTWHDTKNDCWIIVYDRVYDVTEFLEEHPGGSELLLEYAGREASMAFRGAGHSAQALEALDKFLVGELPMHEKIFRNPGGLKLSNIPK